MTYAQAASKPEETQSTVHENMTMINTMNSFFNKIEKLMTQQAQQIGTLMNLLTTVISKLK